MAWQQKTPEQINDDLLRPLSGGSARFWTAHRRAFAAVVAAAVCAFGYQVYNGIGVAGIRRPVFWGFYITNFVFWIGISHAGTLISAILRLVNATWRRPVTRCAEVITVFALMIGAMFPDHPPGPAVAVLLAGSLSERARHLAELPLAAAVGLLRHQHLSDRQRHVPAPADDSGLRAGARPRHRPAQEDLRRRRARLARHAEAVASARERPCRSWRSRSSPWRFPCTPSSPWISPWRPCRCGTRRSSRRTSCAGAIFSGIAALIIAMALLRKFLHLEEYLQPIHFENLGKLLLMMSLLWFYFVFAERLTTWYGNEPSEMAVFWVTQTGSYSPLFWTMVICNFVIPFPILAIKKLRTITGCVIASFGVVVGMWLERFLIIVPSLAHKYLPYSWGTYRPTWVEITITAGTFAAMALLYMLFAKFVPIISIWELKCGPAPGARARSCVGCDEEGAEA